MLADQDGRPSAYDLLAVDPNAPAELIATTYWSIVGGLQKRRQRGEPVDWLLHEVTRAYENVSDPERRADYNAAIGHTLEPLPRRRLRVHRTLRSRLFRRGGVVTGVDYYEVLGISRDAPVEILPAAFDIMRNQYLRIPSASKKRRQLLQLLDEAYATISDTEKRQKYDRRWRRATALRSDVSPAALDATTQPAAPEPAPSLPASAEEPPPPPPPEPSAPPPVTRDGAPDVSGRANPLLAVLRGCSGILLGSLGLVLRGARRGLTAIQQRRPTVAPPPPALQYRAAHDPPIRREPPPRTKLPPVDVEDALLRRLESTVRDVRSSSRTASAQESSKTDA